MIKFVINKNEEGQTLEKYVKKVLPEAPLSIIYRLFRKKDVKVNGHWQDKKYVISEGEEVSIYITDTQLNEFKKQRTITVNEKIKEWIVYEDDNVLLINKPRGVLVQKDNENDSALDDMVISYLISKKEYDPNIDVGYTPAPAHRLDRNTAGIVIFGKNLATLQYFSSVMQDKDKIKKTYLALVKGKVEKSGEINLPLLKKKTHVDVDYDSGKEAITQYQLERYVGDFSLAKVILLTGRTHQIRVHFSKINHPVIGDSKYGDFRLNKEIEDKYNFKNQFLVAYKLEFGDLEGKLSYLSNLNFEVKMPNECLDLLQKLDDNKN